MRTLILSIILLLTISVQTEAREYNFPEHTGRVVDTANQIPEDQEKILTNELQDFQKKSGHQFVVVTIPDLHDIPAYEYAQQLGRHWKIGREGLDDGILMLQSPGDGTPGSADIFIASGGGMEYILTDATLSGILDNTVIPIVKQDRPRSETWPKAIIAGAREVMRLGTITKEQKEEFDRKEKELLAKKSKEAWAAFQTFIGWLFFIALLAVTAFFIYMLATRKRRAAEKEALRVKQEQDRLAKIERDKASKILQDQYNEQHRKDKERRRIAEEERVEAARRAREELLAGMTVAQRAAFLQKEAQYQARAREAERLKREANERAFKIQEEARQARIRQEVEDRAQREQNESGRSSGGYVDLNWFDSNNTNNDNSRKDDDNDDYKGGGGDFFGGGAGRSL